MSSEASSQLQNLLALIHRDGGHYTDAHGIEKSIADAEKHILELRSAIREFCDRVESGEVRSSYTYGKFKQLLEPNT